MLSPLNVSRFSDAIVYIPTKRGYRIGGFWLSVSY